MRVVWEERGPGVVWEDGDTAWNERWLLVRPHVAKVPDAFSDLQWRAWIPYTRPEHLDARYPTDLTDWEDIVANAPVLGPWGETFWPTHREALDFVVSVMATEPKFCPQCGGSPTAPHTLGNEFLVCRSCAEILYPYELSANPIQAHTRRLHDNAR